MRTLLAFAALLAVAFAAEAEVEEGVLVGTEDNFDGLLAKHEFVLAEFYAPWCGHCKHLAPEYAKAAQQLAAAGSPAVLVKVDATIHEKLGSRFEVRGYPTLKFFRKGKDTEYNGGRTAAEIVSWVNKKSGPAAKTLSTVEEAKALQNSANVVVIGFFQSAESNEAKAFIDAAGASDHSFGITTSEAVAAEFKVTPNKIVLLKKFDEGRNDYEGEFTADAISAFVTANQLPLVVEFTDESAPAIFGGSIKSHLLLFVNSKSEDFESLKKNLAEVSKENKGKILFIYIDSQSENNLRIFEFFGLKAADVPAVRLINLEANMAKYKPAGDLSVESLKTFCKDYLAGSLKKHLMSEATPADWDATPVKYLTGSNFAQVALDPTKNVLVEFYAPWCGHCKQLVPTWEALGEKFKDVANVVIAKMDATANELDNIAIESFPTIKFFPAGENAQAEDYEGGRTLKAFADFLNQKAGSNVVVADDAGETDTEEGDYAPHEDHAHEHGDGHNHDHDEL